MVWHQKNADRVFVNYRRISMFRKSLISSLFVSMFLLAGQAIVYTQTAPVNGTVELDKGNGVREPVAGALVEVYRTDIKQGSPSSKTGKKGEFSFVGFMLGGVYALSVSAPGCAPTIFPGVKAGQEKLLIIMNPGDGKKWTEAEVRKAVAEGVKTGNSGSGSTEISEEQKKAQADVAKKNADIEVKNKKIQEGDSAARKANEEGHAALKAENYDLAITKFSEGAAAVPDFVGSTPILLSGKILALKAKGYKTYREGGASTDLAFRKAKYEEANKYYEDGLTAFQEAIAIVDRAEAATEPAEQKRREITRSDLYSLATEIHRLKVVGGVDTSKSAEAGALITQYIALEADPARKLAAQVTLGDVMRLSGDFDKAVEAYRAVLAVKADNAEAMGALGLVLFAQGVSIEPPNKEKMQEGLNLMQKYTEIAPVTAADSPAVKELKLSVKDAVADLKTRNMTPQKITVPSTKKKN